MNQKLLCTLAILSACGLSACIEKQPIDPRYYHQTQEISQEEWAQSPFTEKEIAQAQKDEEALAAALADTSSSVDTNRWKNEVHRICYTEMGFAFGTPAYTTCHDFYYTQAANYGINTNTITLAQINALLLWTNPIIHGCHGHGYLGDALWGCVYHGEHRHYDYWHHHHPHHPRPHHAGPAPHGGPHHGGAAPHHAGSAPHGGGHGGPTPHGGGHSGPAGGHGGAPHGGGHSVPSHGGGAAGGHGGPGGGHDGAKH